MPGQHPTQHDKVCAAAEGFCYITRYRTTAITDNLTAQTVCGIGTFDHRGKLRIAHTGFHTGGTN
ncbi:hypothetical protein D3C75_1166400 [compost metagenome]